MSKKSLFIWIVVSLMMILILAWYVLSSFRFGPGYQDFSKKITGRYMLYRNSEHSVFIAPEDGWSSEDAIIPEKVLKLNDYENFIIAERQGLKRRSLNDSLDLYLIPDSTVKDYWILDTQKNIFIGYLKKQDLEFKMDSLKIPKDLKLIDVYKY